MIKLHMISAIGTNGAIGLKNKLPWDAPDDLRLFRRITDNSAIIVGKRTADSLPPLLNRLLFIWDGKEDPEGFLAKMVQEGIRVAWLCGGAHTYASFAPFVNGNKVINYIDYDGEYDTSFPFEAYKFCR